MTETVTVCFGAPKADAEETEEIAEIEETEEVEETEETEEAEDEAAEDEELEEIEEYETPLALSEIQTVTLPASENGDTEVNVREGADGMAAIFTSLPEGAEVTVMDYEGDWATVVVDGQVGYIYKDDIAGLLDLPEEETAPAPQAEHKVTIFSSRRTVMEEGEPVHLTSKLAPWVSTYTFNATAETLSWGWHLTVLYR